MFIKWTLLLTLIIYSPSCFFYKLSITILIIRQLILFWSKVRNSFCGHSIVVDLFGPILELVVKLISQKWH